MQVALAACDRIVRRDGVCRSDPVVIRLASAAREWLVRAERSCQVQRALTRVVPRRFAPLMFFVQRSPS